MLAGDGREMGKSGESLGPWNETEWQDMKWRHMLELTDTNNAPKKNLVYKDELSS